MKDFRTGVGFDVHAFSSGRKLILGGVEIPFEKGLLGHSDADVLLHALCDALLGSLALGDIGRHFPDSDEKYKNIDSSELLKSVYALVKQKGYILNNLDAVLIIQKPKIISYIPKMKTRIGKILILDEERISIKATTTEELGFIGRGEGISALVNVLVIKEN
ncbi:MAG TPA: 2-C-methyl-D-erythritol 2,4-cyclodiphosphate synthase [Ignavibacteria bacterium]|nr:2-C-methyl-D-erythritol 2,4-cyclodiphosphate synthase [Ignavibacteria bacterium]